MVQRSARWVMPYHPTLTPLPACGVSIRSPYRFPAPPHVSSRSFRRPWGAPGSSIEERWWFIREQDESFATRPDAYAAQTPLWLMVPPWSTA